MEHSAALIQQNPYCLLFHCALNTDWVVGFWEMGDKWSWVHSSGQWNHPFCFIDLVVLPAVTLCPGVPHCPHWQGHRAQEQGFDPRPSCESLPTKDAARAGQGHTGRSDRSPVAGLSHAWCVSVSVASWSCSWGHSGATEASSLLEPSAIVWEQEERGHFSVSGGLALGSLPFLPYSRS